METNVRIANVQWTLSAEGVCGASIVAASILLSSPGGLRPDGGKFMLCVTNDTSNVPLHVEPRITWTDTAGTLQTIAYTQYLLSNTQTFGGSAAEVHTGVLALSGQDIAIPLDIVAGSGLQVALLAASDTASAIIASGAMSLWFI